MQTATTKLLIWLLNYEPSRTSFRWSIALLEMAFLAILIIALHQYQTMDRRWGLKLVMGILGGEVLVGLGTAAFHWVAGALYGLGYLLIWLAWVLTRRWSWWQSALGRGVTAGVTLGPWLWLGATEKEMLRSEPSAYMAEWLLAPPTLVWCWMLLGALWMVLVVGGWGCWRWPAVPTAYRRCLTTGWTVLCAMGVIWYAAGRFDLIGACEERTSRHLGYVLVCRPGSQWYCGLYDWTPLHYAAKAGQAGKIRLLLAAKADVHTQAKDGWTPLHLVAETGSSEGIRLLLLAGADANTKMTIGWTPLHLAVDHAEAVQVLLAAGAKVNERTTDGKTALDLADNDECRTHLRQAGGKTGAELDAEQAKPAQEPVKP